MNAIFVTMGSIYQVYYDAYKEIENKFDNVGFYVCNKTNFEKNFRDDNKIKYLKEWELTNQILNTKIDKTKIEKFESLYFNDEALWQSLNNDRRIFLGKYIRHTQSYTPYYKYNDLLKIFQIFIECIEKFINEIKPDYIFSMVPTTIGDYLFYKVARGKKINYYSLKTVKVGNYQTFTQTISEEHLVIKETFKNYINDNNIEKETLQEAKEYIKKFKNGTTAYEGNVSIPKEYKIFKIQDIKGLGKTIAKDILEIGTKKDHHSRGLNTIKYLYDNQIKSYKANKFKSYTKERTINNLDEVSNDNYVFFPLHAEPEIGITNLAKFYQNQIEFIRNIALQLPSKYKLLIKEHPRNIGRRSLNYYKKLLDIPNVDFVDFDLPSVEVIKRTKVVIVLSGNIGFESVMLGIPVMSFGSAMYNIFPKSIVNYVNNIKDFHKEFEYTLNNFKESEDTLEKYISAVISNSFRLDLYTVLFNKKGREGGSKFDKDKYINNCKALSSEISKLIS